MAISVQQKVFRSSWRLAYTTQYVTQHTFFCLVMGIFTGFHLPLSLSMMWTAWCITYLWGTLGCTYGRFWETVSLFSSQGKIFFFISFCTCFNHQVSIIYTHLLRTYEMSGTLSWETWRTQATLASFPLTSSLLQPCWPQPFSLLGMLLPQDSCFLSSLQFVCASCRYLQS